MKVTRPLTFLTLLVIPRHTSAQGTHEVETHSGCYLPLELFESREVTLRPSVTSVTMAEITLTAQVNLTNSALALAMKNAAVVTGPFGNAVTAKFDSASIRTGPSTTWTVNTPQNLSGSSCQEDSTQSREFASIRHTGDKGLTKSLVVLVTLLVVSGVINLGLLTYVFVLRVEKARLKKKTELFHGIQSEAHARPQPMAPGSPQPMAPGTPQPMAHREMASFDNTVYYDKSRESDMYDNTRVDSVLYDDITTLKMV